MKLGNGRFENTQFNSRLQPVQIGLGSSASTQNLLRLDFDYGATDNNGNVKSQTITVPTVGQNPGFTAVQNYTYDTLNRLKSATETIVGQTPPSWKQAFTYDRYGNRRFDESNTTTIPQGCPEAVCNPQISTTNNRLSSSGWTYDSSGNTTADASGQTFTYDAENKQTEVKDSQNQIIGQYFYDGDGRRIKKIVPNTGEVTIFVYDASGKSIAEYSTIVAPANEAKLAYLTNDFLGSPRINTDANGAVTARHDYHPFGEEITTSHRSASLGYNTDTVRRKFTVYQRDEEIDLDYARLRMYSNRLGRFTSPDPVAADIYTPATHNRYQYCLNNPLRFVDSGGGYDEEVHRDLVAAMAYAAGFSEAQGNAIGNAAQWPDQKESGLSAMLAGRKGYNNRLLYHFTTGERRNDLWSGFEGQINFYGNDPFSALGTFTHADQDAYSHEGFGPGTGQGWAIGEGFDPQQPFDSTYAGMAKYDLTTNDPEKAIRMARDTFSKLLRARNLMEASGRYGTFRKPVPFSAIEKKVGEWALADSREKKKVILDQIRVIVDTYYLTQGGGGRAPKKKKKTKTTVTVLEEE